MAEQWTRGTLVLVALLVCLGALGSGGCGGTGGGEGDADAADVSEADSPDALPGDDARTDHADDAAEARDDAAEAAEDGADGVAEDGADGVAEDGETGPECQNGVVEAGEECDDANAVSGDGCEPDCTFTCTAAADTCAPDEHCEDVTHTCAAGCHLDAGCTDPGVGLLCDTAAHACVACLGSSDCAAGTVCIDGACVPFCDGTHPCPAPLECCAAGCVDTSTSVTHCGVCDHPCTVAHATPACVGGSCAVDSCDPVYGDCDGLPDDGCEIDLLAAADNCGTCGYACTLPDATAGCSLGACTVASCGSGFADCDHLPADGCEVPTATDVTNCGSCGYVCALPDATAGCAAGACTVTSCVVGHEDCNGLPADGCEVTPATDPANCGTCGYVCTLPDATAGCATGACTVTSCAVGHEDCNGLPADGCEVTPATDPANCGSCGYVCTLPDATAGCAASACTVASCLSGYANCDLAAANGCEVSTATDVTNCGTCGYVCTLPDATAGCASGACTVASCASGHADCNLAAADGCEVTPATDPANCGSCGYVCTLPNATAGCAASVCNVASCLPGFTNCDGLPANGCEVSTATDVTNCGTCAHVCALPHATQACNSGACAIGACSPGYADCNHAAGDGCEISTATDPLNCRGCGSVCAAPPHATAACAMSVCGMGACTAGYADCNHAAGDGCEISTTTDPMNCNGCGFACAVPPHATAGCAASACGIGSCTAGYADCDLAAPNGCEVSPATDPANCGSCGHVCALPHATAGCASGGCTVASCAVGYRDCNLAAADGCESASATDNANCGTCGTVCGSGTTCQSGTCRPPNDNFANATALTLGAAETTASGTTAGLTHDGPTSPCTCTTAGNVWYSFTLAAQTVVYADTAGSTVDTSLFLTDSTGAAISNWCGDDAHCTTGGFTDDLQSRVSGVLAAGTYYIAVGGCAAGAFTLHVQRIATNTTSRFFPTPLLGASSSSTNLTGGSITAGTCGGTASGEDGRWFVTCGGQQQFFSVCQSDGGTYTRRIGTTNYDPSAYIRSGQTGGEVTCNDDGGATDNCHGTGTGADLANYGSRIDNVVVPRGINLIVLDERTGGAGMGYTMVYTIR